MRFTGPKSPASSVDADPHGDVRGLFAQLYCPDEFAAAGVDFRPTQVNLSTNAQALALPGIHFQKPSFAESKLVRVVRGRAWDVALDLRPGTGQGRWVACELTAEGMEALFLPEGVAHGFLTLEPETHVLSTRWGGHTCQAMPTACAGTTRPSASTGPSRPTSLPGRIGPGRTFGAAPTCARTGARPPEGGGERAAGGSAMSDTVLLVGCGNMGYAMLKGWIASDRALTVHVVEPDEALRNRARGAGALAVAAPNDLPGDLRPDLVFLAVKPQAMAEVVPGYGRYVASGGCFVSIAAGTTVATLERLLPGPAPIIRCMPNTPAAIGAGMMVCCANERVDGAARELATALLATSGLVDWIENEGLMDAVTALSGSGPAYVFHFIECLTAAGVSLGLPEALAERMATQTVQGAGRLAAEADDPPGRLREQVTSPGGTTAAALRVLMTDERLLRLVTEAVTAARDRGAELARD
jgi:pyrroline-5-carboxylate reductase